MSKKFWVGYILFFIFIFPMIFEYGPYLSTGEFAFGQSTAPIWAIIYLVVGLFAWMGFIVWYYKKFVKSIYVTLKNSKNIVREGKLVTAEIMRKSVEKTSEYGQEIELVLGFNNLVGTPIYLSYPITDSRPQQRRYEVGKTIKMRIDHELRSPILMPDGAEVTPDRGFIRPRLIGFYALILFSVGYLLFSYWFQSQGTGWRFLHFWHPWVTIPFWGLFFGWILVDLLIGRLSGGFGRSSTDLEELLVYKGKLARAEVLSAEQTGLTVNEQPQVRFKLRFTDDRGVMHTASFKKIISLLNLHTVRAGERPILYNPEDPSVVMFAEEYVSP